MRVDQVSVGGGQVRVDLHIPGFVGLFKSPLIFFFMSTCSFLSPSAFLFPISPKGYLILHSGYQCFALMWGLGYRNSHIPI